MQTPGFWQGSFTPPNATEGPVWQPKQRCSPAQFGLQQGPGEAWLSLWSAEGYGGSRLPSLGLAGMLGPGRNIIPFLFAEHPSGRPEHQPL